MPERPAGSETPFHPGRRSANPRSWGGWRLCRCRPDQGRVWARGEGGGNLHEDSVRGRRGAGAAALVAKRSRACRSTSMPSSGPSETRIMPPSQLSGRFGKGLAGTDVWADPTHPQALRLLRTVVRSNCDSSEPISEVTGRAAYFINEQHIDETNAIGACPCRTITNRRT